MDFAITKEIEAQIIQVNIKLKKEENGSVSEYVKLLVEKRGLQELLNQYQNGL
jgi:hypothetical protein